ncbi:unnamed protein product [Ceutorhynchus assimilis]|uniref:Uncharacterized protein n=1 Tax=Ceutorhynchus assimilis TaxID=467358 RepID=A0A9N9MV61_9CUCU|nr:unnamed protein product [Ceutorhynchus assimilis]
MALNCSIYQSECLFKRRPNAKDGEIFGTKCDVCQVTVCKECANFTASEIDALYVQNRTILFFCEGCKASLSDMEQLSKKFDQLKKDHLESDLEDLKSSFQEENRRLENISKAKDDQIKRLQKSSQCMDLEVIEAEQNFESTIKAQQMELKQRNNKLLELTRKNTELSKELKLISKKFADLQSEIMELNNLNNTLLKNISSLSQENDKYVQVSMNLRKKENANKHEDELSTLQETIESLEKKIREKDKYLERLKRNSQVFEEEVSNAEKTLVLQLKKLNKRNTALEEEIKEIKSSKEKINAELESARDAKQVLEVKIKELTALNRDMVVTIETLEKDNQAYLKETKEIQLKLLSIQTVNNVEQQSYETDMDKVRKMSESMLTSIKVLESENQQYSCEINRLEDIIRKLKSVNAILPLETNRHSNGDAGQANAKPENNSHIPYSEQVLRKEDKRNKILILCDEAGRGLNGLLEKKLKQDYCVQCIIKPGAPYVDVIHNMEQLVKDFTKSDCVIVLAGSNEFQQGYPATDKFVIAKRINSFFQKFYSFAKKVNQVSEGRFLLLNCLIKAKKGKKFENIAELIKLNLKEKNEKNLIFVPTISREEFFNVVNKTQPSTRSTPKTSNLNFLEPIRAITNSP